MGDSMNVNPYSGSHFDDFLAEEGILDEVTARAHKRLLALQLQDAMNEVQINKSELASRLQTSRSQLDRLLDPDNTAVTLDSLERLARAVAAGRRVHATKTCWRVVGRLLEGWWTLRKDRLTRRRKCSWPSGQIVDHMVQ